MASLVMGPEGSVAETGEFSDKVPPSFDGHGDYSAYREDVILWIHLTTLSQKKQGPALVGRLSGEAKASVKTLQIDTICSPEGVPEILEHLDKSYAVDETDKLDTDLATFLDYTWKKSMTIEEFIAGFHTRLDKIASLNMDDKLKGHLLLRQALLDNQDRNMIIGAASGKYEVKHVGAALRSAFRNRETPMSSMKSSGVLNHEKKKNGYIQNKNARNKNWQSTKNSIKGSKRPTFYTYRTVPVQSSKHRAIVDSGACTSVVGKGTLDKFMKNRKIGKLPDSSPTLARHRFGNHSEEHRSLFAVNVPFTCKGKDNEVQVTFDVKFDVIEGDLPFLLGFPSLMSMKSTLNRTVRSFFNRLRAVDKKTDAVDLVIEAAYGKNICKGNKLASSFEILYGKIPRILDKYDGTGKTPVTIEQHAKSSARSRLNRMLRSNVRQYPTIKSGDIVHFWRDKSGWIGPASVVKIKGTAVTIDHNGRLKTAGLNRVRKWTQHCCKINDSDDDDEVEWADANDKAPEKRTDKNTKSAVPDSTNLRRSARLAKLQEKPKLPNVGDKIEILWPDDKTYYPGTVMKIVNEHNYEVHYDDGDIENELDMDKEVWRYRESSENNPSNEIDGTNDNI